VPAAIARANPRLAGPTLDRLRCEVDTSWFDPPPRRGI
jgi:hypothetical protein